MPSVHATLTLLLLSVASGASPAIRTGRSRMAIHPLASTQAKFSRNRRIFPQTGCRRATSVKGSFEEKIQKFTWELVEKPLSEEEASQNKMAQTMAGLPIIGLLMQLTNAEGGLDRNSLRFSEFARRILDNVSPQFYTAVEELRSMRGPEISFSTCVYSLWTAAYGAGLMDRITVLDTNRRLAITMDLEYEMATYEDLRDNLIRRKKSQGVEIEQDATISEQVELSVDALARLVQLRPGEVLPEGVVPLIKTLVSECYPSAFPETISGALESYAFRTSSDVKGRKKSKQKDENQVAEEDGEGILSKEGEPSI
ncbi:hypothetical protein AAMO2058_000310000 [Amorphochlora amoebiformis]